MAFQRLGVPHQMVSSNASNVHRLTSLLNPASPITTLSRDWTEDEYKEISATYRETIGSVLPLTIPETGSLRPVICSLMRATAGCRADNASRREAYLMAHAGLSLLGYWAANTTLESVTAMCLLALLLRSFDLPEQAWHVLATTVATAQTLGIHRHSGRRSDAQPLASSNTCVTWWCVYILEKAMSVEMERASSIREDQCSQALPDKKLDRRVFCAAVNLARVQENMMDQLLKLRFGEEMSASDMDGWVKRKIQAVCDLDTRLLQWADALPIAIRPSQYMYCDSPELVGVSFLAIQFHQAIFLLHRHAMIISQKAIKKALELDFSSASHGTRISHGDKIGYQASKEIIGILSHLNDHNAVSALDSLNAPMLALYGLTVHIIRHTTSMPSSADTEVSIRPCP